MHVLAGVRMLAGHASREHIPRQLRMGSRMLELTEGARKWYDVALPVEDMAAHAHELVLQCGPCFVAGNATLLDGLEVYAQTKHAFDWDHRVHALHQLEQQQQQLQQQADAPPAAAFARAAAESVGVLTHTAAAGPRAAGRRGHAGRAAGRGAAAAGQRARARRHAQGRQGCAAGRGCSMPARVWAPLTASPLAPADLLARVARVAAWRLPHYVKYVTGTDAGLPAR